MALQGIRHFLFSAGLCLYIIVTSVYAQTNNPILDVAYHVDYGQYVIDAKGRSLYALTSDSSGESSCYDACAESWPPVLVQNNDFSGVGLAQHLLGTTERKDGSLQLTLGGKPLYYFTQDQTIGDFNGEGARDSWFLVSSEGELIRTSASRQQAEQTEAVPAPTEMADEMASTIPAGTLEEGQAVYTTTASPSCSTCHGAEGGGGAGAALADNARLSDTALVLRQIIAGGHTMPAFGSQLSDRQVAAVATFIRSSWGNEHGEVTPEDASAAR